MHIVSEDMFVSVRHLWALNVFFSLLLLLCLSFLSFLFSFSLGSYAQFHCSGTRCHFVFFFCSSFFSFSFVFCSFGCPWCCRCDHFHRHRSRLTWRNVLTWCKLNSTSAHSKWSNERQRERTAMKMKWILYTKKKKNEWILIRYLYVCVIFRSIRQKKKV